MYHVQAAFVLNVIWLWNLGITVVKLFQKDMVILIFFSSHLTCLKAPSAVLILKCRMYSSVACWKSRKHWVVSSVDICLPLCALKNWIRKWESIVLLLFLNGNISENKSLPPPFFCEDNSGRIKSRGFKLLKFCFICFWFPNAPSSPEGWDEMRWLCSD